MKYLLGISRVNIICVLDPFHSVTSKTTQTLFLVLDLFAESVRTP